MVDNMPLYSVATFLLALIFLAPLGNAQIEVSGTAKFDNPGPQVVAGDYSYAVNFQYGQPQTFRWTTNVTAVRLQMNQETTFIQNYVGDWQYTLQENNDRGYYQWSGYPSPSQNLSQGNVFFLQLFDASTAVGSSFNLATSNYFNITNIPASSSSAPSPSSTSTSARSFSKPTMSVPISTASSTSTATVNPAGATPTPAPKKNNSLAIGLGVGLGLAFLLALIAAGLFYRKYKKRPSHGGNPEPVRELAWEAGSPYRQEGALGQYSRTSEPVSSFHHQTNSTQSWSPPPQQLPAKWGGSMRSQTPELPAKWGGSLRANTPELQ